jgi:phosphoglycolate phosphatase-like HAD superfamily hydrolase
MRAIIFDFDGTIGDSFKVAVEIGHAITHRSQLVLPEEVVRLRKLRMLDVARELKLPKWQWPFLLVRGRRQMSKRLREVQPFPGIDGVLRELRRDGYDLYIMSSNSQRNIQRFMTAHGMITYISKIYSGVSLLGKARALRGILKETKLSPKDVIYVGDEVRDVEAANRVGMPCVAVAWGYNAPELLTEQAPMVVVRTIEQLQHVLEEWGSELS